MAKHKTKEDDAAGIGDTMIRRCQQEARWSLLRLAEDEKDDAWVGGSGRISSSATIVGD